MVRPGCKTVSILGKMRKPGSSKRTGMLQKRLAAKQRTTPTNLSEAEKQTYENELEELKETIKKLNAQLAKLNKRNSVYDHDKAIKQKKNSWSSSRTVELYLEIRNLKRVRFQEFREQELVRISLKSARTQAFLKRKVSSFLYLA
jgi:DNA gyrase/topoisomerase IV subunit A